MPNVDLASYPDPFYIFVDHASPMTWHNFNLTGRFCSAAVAAASDPATLNDTWPRSSTSLPFVPSAGFSGFVSPFLNNLITDYRVEWDAEQARRVHAPDAPSRLSAVFAFGSHADCQLVSKSMGGRSHRSRSSEPCRIHFSASSGEHGDREPWSDGLPARVMGSTGYRRHLDGLLERDGCYCGGHSRSLADAETTGAEWMHLGVLD